MKNKNILSLNKTKLKKWIFYWFLVGTSTFILIFLITSTLIGMDVKQQCQIAQGKYEGDCVEVLMQVLDDSNNTLRERNMAIWALGQLGDKRALQLLKKYYTGKIPNREPYDKTISQYELKKAIKLLDDGFNATAFVWR